LTHSLFLKSFFLASLILGITLGADPAHSKDTFLSVTEGQPAPDFSLRDQEGNLVVLSGHRGKWVVLYFYPKDDTPGCTKEACSFRDNIVAIQQINAVVLGVSVDSVKSHKAFSEKFNLNFPILADSDHKVCKLYGTLTQFRGEMISRRSTVIIDPEGVIRKVFPSVQPTDHALEIHRALIKLKDSI